MVQALAGRIGDRDEDFVRTRRDEHGLHLVGGAEHGDSLDPPPAKRRIVVEEAHDAGVRVLPELSNEATPRASRADEEHPAAVATAVQHA
jgi:hypothetical protein